MPPIFQQYRNRRITCGPPSDWIDPIPSNKCELLIRNLPKGMNGEVLLLLLKRFGIIFKLRSLPDLTNVTSSFAFARYTIELDALAAIEMINRHFLASGRRLEACKSFTQQSLFIANIPKTISYEIIYDEFMRMFPNIRKLVLSNALSIDDPDYAIIKFESYEEALKVYQTLSAKGIRMWGADLKFAWAHYRPKGITKLLNTIIIRRLNNDRCYFDFLMKLGDYFTRDVVRRMELSAYKRVITFRSLESATQTYVELKKICYSDFTVEPLRVTNILHNSTKPLSDYCAELRMICIANNWQIPIVLFGTNFRKNNLQYGAVFVTDGRRNFTSIFMEIDTTNISDIQSEMCELVVGLVNKFSGLLNMNLVYRISNRIAYYVCNLNNLLALTNKSVPYIRSWESIHKMTLTVQKIFMLSDEEILFTYRISLLDIRYGLQKVLPNCLPVYPKYRNMPVLPYNLNDTEIVLVLKDNISDTQLPSVSYANEIDSNAFHFATKETPQDYEFKYVDAGSCSFYHPSQKINFAPIWIPGHTYSYSVKNLLN